MWKQCLRYHMMWWLWGSLNYIAIGLPISLFHSHYSVSSWDWRATIDKSQTRRMYYVSVTISPRVSWWLSWRMVGEWSLGKIKQENRWDWNKPSEQNLFILWGSQSSNFACISLSFWTAGTSPSSFLLLPTQHPVQQMKEDVGLSIMRRIQLDRSFEYVCTGI
jgi:hypothetical protein